MSILQSMPKGKAYANRKPLEERPEADYYSTPYSLTRELLKLGLFYPAYPVYEPASGETGAIAKVLKDEGFVVVEDDIRTTGKDFLDYSGTLYKYIITNPPFSLFDEFVMKAKEYADQFAFIMKTNFLGAHSRQEKGIWKNLKYLYIFDRQVDYRTPLLESGRLCVGNLITGWGIWDMNWKRDYFETRIIDIQQYCTLGSYDKYLLKNK